MALQSIDFLAYLVNVIPDKGDAHYIIYLRFY